MKRIILSLLFFISLLMLPNYINAETITITQTDFDNASQNGVESNGVSYVAGENEYETGNFYLKNGNYILGSDIEITINANLNIINNNISLDMSEYDIVDFYCVYVTDSIFIIKGNGSEFHSKVGTDTDFEIDNSTFIMQGIKSGSVYSSESTIRLTSVQLSRMIGGYYSNNDYSVIIDKSMIFGFVGISCQGGSNILINDSLIFGIYAGIMTSGETILSLDRVKILGGYYGIYMEQFDTKKINLTSAYIVTTSKGISTFSDNDANSEIDYYSDELETLDSDIYGAIAVVDGKEIDNFIDVCEQYHIKTHDNDAPINTWLIKFDNTVAIDYEFDLYQIDVGAYILTTVINGDIDDSFWIMENIKEQEVSYNPDSGYALKSVIVDGVEVDKSKYYNTYTFNGSYKTQSIMVIYALDENSNGIPDDEEIGGEEPNSFMITTSSTYGTITPSTEVIEGNNFTVTYTSNTGYALKSITVDNNAVDREMYSTSYTFSNVTSEHVINVVYASDTNNNGTPDDEETFTITTSVTNGTITPSTVVAYGSSLTVYYSPNIGYNVRISTEVDGEDTELESNLTSYTFNNITSNHTISVVYALDENNNGIPDFEEYLVTTSATNGNITESTYVFQNDNFTVNYNAIEGYTLKSIEVDNNVIDRELYPTSYTFNNVSSVHSINVTYVLDENNNGIPDDEEFLIVTIVANGTITEWTYVIINNSITIEYSPNNGFALYTLIVDDQMVNRSLHKNSYTFNNVTTTHTISVVYVLDENNNGIPDLEEYLVTTNVSNGTITESTYVYQNDNFTVNYNANEGYTLKSIEVDNNVIDRELYPTSYTFNKVRSIHSINIVYVLDEDDNGVPDNEEYRIIQGDNQTYVSGNDVTITASGNINLFVKLLIDAEELDEKYYSVESGSTIVTLKSNYLKTLDTGTHLITFVYQDGEVSTNLSIVNNPTTSDNIYLYIWLLISSFGILMGLKKIALC